MVLQYTFYSTLTLPYGPVREYFIKCITWLYCTNIVSVAKIYSSYAVEYIVQIEQQHNRFTVEVGAQIVCSITEAHTNSVEISSINNLHVHIICKRPL